MPPTQAQIDKLKADEAAAEAAQAKVGDDIAALTTDVPPPPSPPPAPPPPAVVADKWVKLTGNYKQGDPKAGPWLNQGWWKGCVIGDGSLWIAFSHGPNPNYGTFRFYPANDFWTKTNTDTTSWHKNLGGRENYDTCFDASRNKVLISSGGPVGWTRLATDIDPRTGLAFGPNPAPGFNGAWDANTSPQYGEMEYDVAKDEFSTPYPQSTSIYVPLPSDAGYFGKPGPNLNGFDVRYSCPGDGWVYEFGGWSVGAGQAFRKRNLTTGQIVTLQGDYTKLPSWTQTPARSVNLRSGYNTTRKEWWTVADNEEFCTANYADPTTWTHQITTGDRPTSPPPGDGSTGPGWGWIFECDEANDRIVAWCGYDASSGTTGMVAVRDTRFLDRKTLVWTKGPSAANGDVVPPSSTAVSENLFYDPVGKRMLLLIWNAAIPAAEVWTLSGSGGIVPIPPPIITPPPPPVTPPVTPTLVTLTTPYGKIVGMPLPSAPASALLPFTNNGASKQADMGYCPLNNRIYAQGGDGPVGSADDRTVSVDATLLTDWRLDVGRPVYPTLVAPHALQDDFGAFWSTKHKWFWFVPGGNFAYDYGNNAPDPAIYPNLNLACGIFKYDPIANLYTQDRTLFGKYLVSPTNTGSPFGGVFDDQNEIVMTFGDIGGTYQCNRWNLDTMTKLTPVPFTIPKVAPGGAYFTRGEHTVIGRKVYIVGYRTDGFKANQKPCMFCWDMDALTMVELAPPPVNGALMSDIEIRVMNSHGKVVYPFVTGPDGEIAGIHIYDPATGKWVSDFAVPASGAFIGNSFLSLPDGRVIFAGAVFGRQQTHIWSYEAN